MSRLEVAVERLAKALESLEQAALSRAGDAKAAGGFEAEREQLTARIAELEEETRSLSGLTEEVEGRLDGAIAEIRTALGR